MKYLPGSKNIDVAARRQLPELRDYLTILNRRKLHLVWPVLLLVAVSAIAAFALPPVYYAEATILVENQEIPEEFVSTTVTGYMQERVNTLTRRLLTEENLWEIVEKFDLYQEERKTAEPQAIAGQMRGNVTIEPVSINVIDPNSGRPVPSTVALTLAFEAEKPETAQQVANELAERFLEINRAQRTEQTTEVAEFLAAQGEKMREEIAELEAQLAKFKQKNVGRLPEQAGINMQFLNQAQDAIKSTEEHIRTLRDQQITLSAQLAITNPNKEITTEGGGRLLSVTEQLRVLQAELREAQVKYSPEHPDVIRLKQEIASVEAAGGGGANELALRLASARAQLSEARRNYTRQHPDVQRLEQTVQELQQAMVNADPGEALYPDNTIPDNPTYVSLRTQLDTIVANITSEQEKLARLNAELDKYESRLFSTPAVERDYLALTRDYDNARTKYNELKDQLLEARLAVQLETGNQGAQLSLLTPASLPSTPYFPNRPAFILVGAALGIVGGIGAGSIIEYMDRAVHGARGVIGIFQAPPLAAIPYIDNSTDRARKRRRRSLVFLAMAAGIALLLIVAFAFWQSLGELDATTGAEEIVGTPPADTAPPADTEPTTN